MSRLSKAIDNLRGRAAQAVDAFYEVTSPSTALERQRQRLALDVARQYDAARPNRLSGGYNRRGRRASDEVSRGHKALAGGAQDLVRNNALATRAKHVASRNMVGKGIKPDYMGPHKRQLEKYKDTFRNWSESTDCDYEQHTNFYGLQNQIAAAVFESGGVLVRKVINNDLDFPLVLQLFEQQYLDSSKRTGPKEGQECRDGIVYNSNGTIAGYWILTSTVSTQFSPKSEFFPAEDIVHVFWKDRPGQHLGVSWLHPTMDLIDQRQEWRDAVLVQQRIAACLGVIIKEPSGDMGLGNKSPVLRDGDGHEFSELEAGMVSYTDQTTEIHTITPPNLSHTTDFNDGILQDISVGTGLTKEQLTGDFSKVTWASGRLARGEFYTNLDAWQDFMLIPQLNRIHQWFDDIYTIKYGKPRNITRNWIIPHRSAVNPKEELEVDIKKVRSAAMTPQQFSRKHGVRFEDAIAGWKEAREKMQGMAFDFDPEKFSSAGNQIMEVQKKEESQTTDD